MNLKNLADYVPVMVALTGVFNTILKRFLKYDPEKWEQKISGDDQSDLEVISAQLEEILKLLKAAANEEKRRSELADYLEKCKKEKKD